MLSECAVNKAKGEVNRELQAQVETITFRKEAERTTGENGSTVISSSDSKSTNNSLDQNNPHIYTSDTHCARNDANT